MLAADTPIFPADLMHMLGITHNNTLGRMLKSGRIPQPDVRITRKTRYWHRSTLVKAGLIAEGDSGNNQSA